MDFDKTEHRGLDHTIGQKLIQKCTICLIVFLPRQLCPVEPSAYGQYTPRNTLPTEGWEASLGNHKGLQ